MAPMKEQIKTPELSDKEIDNLSDAKFKTLVIRMLTEMTDLGLKMKEVKKRKIYREPTVKERNLGLKSIIWKKRKT